MEDETESHDYVIILSKTSGSMKFCYTTVDPITNTLAPKLDRVNWPRLKDIVDFASCVLKNVLYVTGGRDRRSGQYLREVLRYEPDRGRWFECASMKTCRARHVAVVYNNRLFVMGGATRKNELTEKCESYEPLLDEWHPEEDLPGVRKDHRALTSQGSVFVSGGVSQTQNANDNVWRMSRYWPDPSKPQKYTYIWEHLRDPLQRHMTYKLANHCMALCHDRLFFAGGLCHGYTYDGANFIRGGDMSESFEPGQPSTKPMLATSNMLEAFRLYVQLPPEPPVIEEKGGKKDKEKDKWKKRHKRKEEEEVEEVEILKSNWIRNYPDMPKARAGAGCVVIGHKIYIVGGHAVEEERASCINTAIYFHIKKKQWFRAFCLGDGDFRDVECVQLSVPTTNRDFRPMKYSDCKWVLW